MQLLICCQGQWAGDRGGAAPHIGMVIHQSARWHARRKEGRAARRWQGHQFHETFPPLHLKARHNHAPGRCTMKWNGRPDPGERTQCRVHRNEGHSLPGDASVSRKGPAGPGQTVAQGSFMTPPHVKVSFLTWVMQKYTVYIYSINNLLRKWHLCVHHLTRYSEKCNW